MQPDAQLSFFAKPRVLLRYHCAKPPPDATGPCDWGVFGGSLAGRPDLCGWGRTELCALTELARLLHGLSGENLDRPRLTAIGQALMAAGRRSHEDLVEYLARRAAEPVLA